MFVSLQSRSITTGQATLAQSVEQRIRNAQVVSSSLMSGSQRVTNPCHSLFLCALVFREEGVLKAQNPAPRVATVL